jgi:hypothetical protein
LTPPRVNARARTREDRAGDPLDGLVNLFDLGIVLAVAFLLAALSSIDLAPSVLKQNSEASDSQQVPADSVIVKPGEEDNLIELQEGAKVVGQGEQVGTVYRLQDGRTVIVKPETTPPVPGEERSDDSGAGSTSPSEPDATTTPSTATPPTATTPSGGDTPTTSPAQP